MISQSSPVRDEVEAHAIHRPRQRKPADQQDEHEQVRGRRREVHHLATGNTTIATVTLTMTDDTLATMGHRLCT